MVLKRKREHAVRLLKQMVAIPSCNPDVSDNDEKEIASFLKEELDAAGFRVDLQQITTMSYYAFAPAKMRRKMCTRPNVIARAGKKGGPKLLLNGHIDTVSGETMKGAFEPRIIGDRIYGRGSADMKGGVAAIIAASEAILESNRPLTGELVLSLVVGEETSGAGTKEFLKRERGDFAVVAEPTENTMAIAQGGYVDFSIYCTGESTHGLTTIPDHWASAFVQATNLCNRILQDQHIIRRKKYHGIELNSTFNFSPTHYSPPPSYAMMTMPEYRAHCELGLVPETTVAKSMRSAQAAVNRIKEHVAEGNRHGMQAMCQHVDFKVGFIQAKNTYTRAFARAMDKVLGHHRQSYEISFCDASYFYYRHIPVILFGPGKIEIGHGSSEYVSTREVRDATSVFFYAIENILGQPST